MAKTNSTEDLATDLVGTAKKGFKVLLKAAAITLGLAAVGGIAGGIAGGAAALGGLATFGMVVGGIVVGGIVGNWFAAEYVMSKAGKVAVQAGKFLDDLNNELSKQQAPKPAQAPGPVATAEAGSAFNAAAAPANDNAPAPAAAPIVAAPKPPEQKL